MSEHKSVDKLTGVAVASAFLTVGLISLIAIDGAIFAFVGNLMISFSLLGYGVEISKLMKRNSQESSFFSDIGVGIFLALLLYWTWSGLIYLEILNNWWRGAFLFILIILFTGLYRGLIGITIILINSKSKKLNMEILVQLGGLIIAFLALFISR